MDLKSKHRWFYFICFTSMFSKWLWTLKNLPMDFPWISGSPSQHFFKSHPSRRGKMRILASPTKPPDLNDPADPISGNTRNIDQT